MILNYKYFELYCILCGKQHTDNYVNRCDPCQIKYLKENFINWTSGNEKIDNFIQEKHSKISSRTDMVFEWIPYDQFSNIKEMGKDDLNNFTIYSATWKGQLHYDDDKHEYERKMSKVTLKYPINLKSQDLDEFLNEV